MILSPFGKGGGRGFPFHETFLLRVQFGPIWSRGESKRNLRAEDRGSKLLPLYRWTNYITLVTILFEILFRVCLLPIFFLPSFPNRVSRIFSQAFRPRFIEMHSWKQDTAFFILLRFDWGNIHPRRIIKPWRIFLDNIFLHFSLLRDDNILSILVTKSAIHFG